MLDKHKKLEKNSILLLVCTVIAVSVGGIVEIIPLFRMDVTIEKVEGMRPYTPLELMGQNVYIRENCNSCHSQQIRPLRDEVERYGHYSLAAESMYDHPFLWGSKRTGPDLARVGGKFSDEWHAAHMKNPRDVVPESIMPSYAFLANRGVNLTKIDSHLKALRAVGVPYTDEMIEQAYNDATAQARADGVADGLRARYGDKVNVRDFDGQPNQITEMDALISYLQVLGTMADLRSYNPDIEEMGNGND
ncbi:MAG: cytochrome-c oxidase, cbb3-type subunit II [Bdellovibrionales bacterium]|jgi:cytochrome c oxidase cbb3-type subunit 2|nr:cytochrome-c oxidase, cbb3-type subunit II [Bdellovibrionales bacterium]